MTRYAVFLRGVNVGGVKVLMKDLTQLFLETGFTEVKTLLASGNVVLNAQSSSCFEVQELCNTALSEHYQRSIPTLVYSKEEIQQLAEPFPLTFPEPAGEYHGYFTLCESADHAQELGASIQALDEHGDFLVENRALSWLVRKGESTNNSIAKLIEREAKRRVITTRNHNTLVKVAKILG